MELNRKLSQKRQRELVLELTEILMELYSEQLTPEELKLGKSLIEEIAFMKVILFTLKQDIIRHGAVYLFKNGKQEMLIESPYQKSYNAMISKYNATFSSLSKMFPKAEDKEGNKVEDKLDDFFESMGNDGL